MMCANPSLQESGDGSDKKCHLKTGKGAPNLQGGFYDRYKEAPPKTCRRAGVLQISTVDAAGSGDFLWDRAGNSAPLDQFLEDPRPGEGRSHR